MKIAFGTCFITQISEEEKNMKNEMDTNENKLRFETQDVF